MQYFTGRYARARRSILLAAGGSVGLLLAISFCPLPTSSAPPVAQNPAAQKIDKPAQAHALRDAAEARLQKILDAPVTVDFYATPLAQAAQILSDKCAIDVRVDERSLEQTGIAADVPVTLDARRISLRAVLGFITQQTDTAFLGEDGSLLLTSLEAVEMQLSGPRVYAVDDLADESGEVGKASPFDLTDAIISAIEPNSWDQVGGPGSVQYTDGALIVSQSDVVHDQIGEFLAGLRALPALGDPRLGVVRTTWTTQKRRAGLARLERVLDQRITWGPGKTTLRDLARLISNKFGITVQVDRRALDDVGISGDQKVTFAAQDIQLRTALRQTLRPLELNYTFYADEILLITTPEVLEEMPQLRIYPVFDLLHLPTDASAVRVFEKASQLVDALQSVVQPNTWDTVGGVGSIHVYEYRGALLVRQTREVHEAIDRLLHQLRRTADEQAHVTGLNDESKPVLIVYRQVAPQPQLSAQGHALPLPKQPDLREFVPMIRAQIEPDSWNDPNVYLAATADRIVLRHRPGVQRQVEELLDQLGVQFVVSTERETRSGGDSPPNRGVLSTIGVVGSVFNVRGR